MTSPSSGMRSPKIRNNQLDQESDGLLVEGRRSEVEIFDLLLSPLHLLRLPAVRRVVTWPDGITNLWPNPGHRYATPGRSRVQYDVAVGQSCARGRSWNHTESKAA